MEASKLVMKLSWESSEKKWGPQLRKNGPEAWSVWEKWLTKEQFPNSWFAALKS